MSPQTSAPRPPSAEGASRYHSHVARHMGAQPLDRRAARLQQSMSNAMRVAQLVKDATAAFHAEDCQQALRLISKAERYAKLERLECRASLAALRSELSIFEGATKWFNPLDPDIIRECRECGVWEAC